MSSSGDPSPPSQITPPIHTDIPPVVEDKNPFSAPKSIEDYSSPFVSERAAALGFGYWVSVVASLLILAFTIVYSWESSIFVGWIFFFAALRVPLRDVRRRSLHFRPTLSRMFFGAGDYWLSVVLCAGLSLAMCTVFMTVCTATGLGLSAARAPESAILTFAFGGGGLAAITAFLFLYGLSLRF